MFFNAIIVLANEMDSSGILNNESKSRAIKAVEMFKYTSSRYILACGWNYRVDTDIKIADAFKKYMNKELGVSNDNILVEANSRDTVGDAYFTKVNFSNPLSWDSICIITSDYHASRAQEIFSFIYGSNFNIKVSTAYTNINIKKSIDELSSTEAFRNTFYDVEAGDDNSILNTLRTKHPFYNGEIYSKI